MRRPEGGENQDRGGNERRGRLAARACSASIIKALYDSLRD